MKSIEMIRIAWIALLSNKLRGFLTLIGIVIGISAVLTMLAIGTGFERYLEDEFRQFAGLIEVFPGTDSPNIADLTRTQLQVANAKALRQPGAAPAVQDVAFTFSGQGMANTTARSKKREIQIEGVSSNYFRIKRLTLNAGRIFTEEEGQTGARVTVIEQSVADRLFGSATASIGQRLTVDGVGFDVVGVIQLPPTFGLSPPATAFIPYETAVTRLFRNQIDMFVDVNQLIVQPKSPEQANEATEQITEVLRREHRLSEQQSNGFTVFNNQQELQQTQSILRGFTAFLAFVSGFSLLIGGIGVMNIMLVSVTERTREIGLRKAVGARQGDILLQFLVEAVVLSVMGGVIGIACGYLLTFVGTFVLGTVFAVQGAQAIITPGALLLVTTVTSIIGLVFGFFPAWQASRLTPIQALRAQ